MKKRILSILLVCCMVLVLLPTTVFANNDGAKAIQLGTSGISGYDSTNRSYDYIYFGTWNNSTVKWRVLDTKTNMPNAQEGDGFFLLSDALLGTGAFGGVEFDYTTPYTNDWKGSRGQDWCNGFYTRNLSTTEQKAVFATSKSDDPYIDGRFMGSENILNGDKVFFLSAEEAGKAAYGFIDDNARIANYGDSAGGWWLRSPHQDYNSAGVVNASGGVRAEWVNDTNAARPAFNLKPDSVLLVSAAVGGKGAADGIFKIPEYSGDEWKLTLLDDTRTFRVTETAAVGKPGGSVTLNFSGARTGQNEYISAIIKGESGATHYGRIMKPTAADTQLSFTLPYDLDSGNYKLYVFSEQCNGDYKTDYASRFQAVALTVEEAANEQFDLVPGGRYYFDLSAMGIPGTANGSLPDASLHYVPFTYTGIVDAYTLTSKMATTDAYAERYKYPHSLFVADFAVTHTVNWNALNDASLIFGKGYAAGGVEYTLRAPSVGSDVTAGSDDLECGTPQSNEWDRMLDKNNGYIKNWSGMSSWGQDTPRTEESGRAVRGYDLARGWHNRIAATSDSSVGFRPVLEVLNPDTLGSDGLKAVVLDLGGGKLGNRSENIQIIVKSGESFTAPGGDGLTRPDGNTGSYFMWLGSDGELYDPGDSVPAVVNKLTARFAPIEQFSLVPGGTYYFDLSGTGIRGTAHSRLPDKTLHYVPFTYAGTVDAYALTSEMATTDEYAEKHKYPHSLFVADFAVTHTISWENLNAAGLIFGKNYTANSVEYTMRVPSAGRSYRGSGDSVRGNPQSNEWDKILDKYDGYIRNCNATDSWGQDVAHNWAQGRAMRGYSSVRNWNFTNASDSGSHLGFRPILEVLNPDTLKPNGLKAVALDLGGGKLGGNSDNIQIIVKNGSEFTAPASDGLTRPDGDTGSYFVWFGSDGNLYAPGESVSADVTKLTAQFEPGVYTVTITTDTLPDGKVGEAYSQTLSADGTTPITWSVENGDRPTGLSLNKDTGEISGTPTAAGTSTFTVKATNSAGSDTKELSITITKAAPAEYTVRFNANGGGGTMEDVTGVSGSYTLPACGFTEPEGKQFKGWSTSADGSVISSTTYEVSSDTTFYAIWESKEYSIIVTDGKATIGAGSEISKAAQGTTITLTANAAPDGKVFDKWVVESGNTTLEDANSETTTFIMPDSEVSVKATYTIPHTHTYDQEIQKPETLKSAADCTNDAVYFKSCSCGEISTTETFTAAGTQLGHAWASDWSKDTDNHWKECSRCHEKKDEAAHDYGSDNICDTCGYDKTVPHTHNLTLVPAKAPTCTEKGNTAYYTCDGCDKWFEDATGASEITDKTSVILAATGHSASDWKSDNTDHWKECTVVGCGVIIEGSKAAHTAGEWIIDTPATATTSGSKHKECTVCGYTMATETIPATGGGEHTHSYGSEWKNDADNHWHECSCGDK